MFSSYERAFKSKLRSGFSSKQATARLVIWRQAVLCVLVDMSHIPTCNFTFCLALLKTTVDRLARNMRIRFVLPSSVQNNAHMTRFTLDRCVQHPRAGYVCARQIHVKRHCYSRTILQLSKTGSNLGKKKVQKSGVTLLGSAGDRNRDLSHPKRESYH